MVLRMPYSDKGSQIKKLSAANTSMIYSGLHRETTPGCILPTYKIERDMDSRTITVVVDNQIDFITSLFVKLNINTV